MPHLPQMIAASLLMAAGLGAATPVTRPPNLVFIMVDDQGAADAGFAGSRYYETPRMDRLAAEGMRFTCTYTCGPNCAPTRASLLSGMYGPRTGIYTVAESARGPDKQRRLVPVPNRTVMKSEVVTWAEQVRQAGYATGMIGKWHLGGTPDTLPTGQGFLVNIAGCERGSTKSYFSPYGNAFLSDGPAGEHLTDRLAEEAARFIRDNAGRPFCLYFAQYAVHTPLQPKPELVQRFADRKPAGEQNNAKYAALLYGADAAVGRVLDELDAQHLADDTLVIVTSDNGGVEGITGQAPLRGYKGMLYEGGIRVPMLMRWPGRIRAGATCDEPVITVDFYPTILEVTGAKPPSKAQLDGMSLVPLMRGERHLRRDTLYWHFPCYTETQRHGHGRGDEDPFRTRPVGAIRQGDLKLLEFFEDQRLELYDLAADPGESRDLSRERPQLAAAMVDELRAWRVRTDAAMPTPKR